MKIKKYILIISTIFCITIIFISCKNVEKKCIIKGKTVGFNCKTITLVKVGEDFRFNGIEVPVIDSSFTYELIIDQIEGYRLVFKESEKSPGFRFTTFFAEPNKVQITLYSEDLKKKNYISGGNINKEFSKYLKIVDEKYNSKTKPLSDSLGILSENGIYFSNKANTIMQELATANNFEKRNELYRKLNELEKTGENLSDNTKKIYKKIEKYNSDKADWELNYISENKTIVSYFLLYEILQHSNFRDNIDINLAKDNYNKLANKFPSHPYTESIGILFESINNIKIGGRYIDFSVPDLNGNIVKLSDIIKGKIALIDLWATWCGPCIAHSRTMIPVYEEYKDSGFVIVGVAGEFKNTERLEKLLEKEKFPWLNLVELDKQNRIWDKYGISNSGGKSFLIDKDGKIIAIHPTAEEVREIIQN